MNTLVLGKKVIITKKQPFEQRLGKKVIIRKKIKSFEERLGKKVIIIKKDANKLLKKKRYLNTTSNKKKLLAFNDNITDLEKIRLLYNEDVQRYNTNVESHNEPIKKRKRQQNYQLKKEEKIKKRQKKEKQAANTIINYYRNRYTVKLDESAYINYYKFSISGSFLKNKYSTIYYDQNREIDKNSKDYKIYQAIMNYYKDDKDHINDLRNNRIITHMDTKLLYNTLYDCFELFKRKLKNINYQCMRIFCTIKYETIVTNKEENIQIAIIPDASGRFDITNMDFEKFEDHFIGFDNILLKEYLTVLKIHEITMSVLKYDPLQGASYTQLPQFIKNTGSIINIKNKDDKCFLWSCIASRHLPERDAERVKQYEKYIQEFNCDKINFPMKLTQIANFEKNNNININVYTAEDKDTKYPIHLSKQDNKEVINLFFYDNHYSLIKNFSRFCGSSHKYNCQYCLKSYANTNCYKNHVSMCQSLNSKGSNIIMPKENTFTTFTGYSKMKKCPIVMYADFESSLEKHHDDNKKYIVSKHVANSYRLIIKTELELDIDLEYSYVGKDTDIHFVQLLSKLNTQITLKLRELAKIHDKPILSKEEQLAYKQCTICSLCNKIIQYDPKNNKVRDHCHFTGKYLGAAHQNCNLKSNQIFKGNMKIPLFFHNANYDIKCFINAFRTLNPEDTFKRIGGVPCNMEIYKTLNIDNICIMDSYAHLSASLSSLISNLPDDKKINLKSITSDSEKFKLINEKGFYPYEFVDCIEKLDTPIHEIKREHFNSKLMLSKLSDYDWNHIQNVIQKFNIKTLREWHDLYLKIDVYGLADVFEYYRELSYETYSLDPAHYIGLPSYTWDSGLKYTNIKLQNLTDPDMYMFFEKMKRGGISVISQRHAKANNPYLPDYDENIENSYIYQVDCNNLYGWSMCENLPTDGFKWIIDFDLSLIDSYKSTDSVGYVLQVDLDYPDSLHVEHNDYPLAPEHLNINKTIKLTPNLQDKKDYIIHIDNLQYYIKKGLILKKVHRVIKFNQSAWLKPYIEKNSKLRQASQNDFQKDFYKLLNNTFYGKTMENIRDRVNVQFCKNQKEFVKHTSSPLFANQINVLKKDGLILVKTNKKTVELNKPIYLGACILESSKLLMFKFHYDTMKVKYPKCSMMKTDTDSLCYYIQTKDLYQDIKEDKNIQKQMEFSNYPKDHILYNSDRKKVPGLFQDECVDDKLAIISEYIGLRAKSYSNYLYYPTKEEYQCKKKSKGVPSRHIKNRVGFQDYKDCLFNKKSLILGSQDSNKEHQEKIYSFRSLNLITYSIEQSKIALSCNDDKRHILEDNIHTLALGHYKIPK